MTPKFVVLLLCVIGSISSYGQCSQKLKLEKQKQTAVDPGAIILHVESSNNFKVTLVEFSDQNEEIVLKTNSAYGSQSVRFENISNTKIYKLVVEFTGEDKFLCKTKVFTGISLTDNK